MDALECLDSDYDFKGLEDENEGKNELQHVSTNATENQEKMIPKDLAEVRMNLVMNVRDEDSVSTLGSPKKTPMKKSNAAPRNGMIIINKASPEVSAQSSMTMETRVTALEDQILSMETNLASKFEQSFAQLLARLPSINQPPGGESAGQGA